MIGHPSLYKLIGEIDRPRGINEHRHLRRLSYGLPVPEGFEEITWLNRNSAYRADGTLRRRFWGLKRIMKGAPQ